MDANDIEADHRGEKTWFYELKMGKSKLKACMKTSFQKDKSKLLP